MTEAAPTVRRAEPAELDRVAAMLATADLPHEDVREKPGCFSVALADGELVGAGGVEVRGSAGLLRSVVVAEPHRGRGFGTAIVEALEARARAEGVETLYLLTTTAAAFFRERGYEAVPRATAPPAVRETTEFAGLCPDSATCMRRVLR